MLNKLIISEAHINEKNEKLFWIESEFDYELRKTGFFQMEDNNIIPFNFSFERIYDDESRELLTILIDNLDKIKELFKYSRYNVENKLVIKEG